MVELVEISLVSSYEGDWEILYISGKMVAEGHRVDIMGVLGDIFNEGYEPSIMRFYTHEVSASVTYDYLDSLVTE